MGEVFPHGDEFPRAIFCFLGDGFESIVHSPLSDEESGRVLIWDFEYDSYVSCLCRFGLMDYYWVPTSTWLAFLMVYCCALSLGSSLFSEVLRTSSPLRGLKHELSARLASALWLGDVIQLLEIYPA